MQLMTQKVSYPRLSDLLFIAEGQLTCGRSFDTLCQVFFLQCFCIQITNCDVGVFDRVTGACNPVPGQSAGTYGGKLCNTPNQLPIHIHVKPIYNYITVLDFFWYLFGSVILFWL